MHIHSTGEYIDHFHETTSEKLDMKALQASMQQLTTYFLLWATSKKHRLVETTLKFKSTPPDTLIEDVPPHLYKRFLVTESYEDPTTKTQYTLFGQEVIHGASYLAVQPAEGPQTMIVSFPDGVLQIFTETEDEKAALIFDSRLAETEQGLSPTQHELHKMHQELIQQTIDDVNSLPKKFQSREAHTQTVQHMLTRRTRLYEQQDMKSIFTDLDYAAFVIDEIDRIHSVWFGFDYRHGPEWFFLKREKKLYDGIVAQFLEEVKQKKRPAATDFVLYARKKQHESLGDAAYEEVVQQIDTTLYPRPEGNLGNPEPLIRHSKRTRGLSLLVPVKQSDGSTINYILTRLPKQLPLETDQD